MQVRLRQSDVSARLPVERHEPPLARRWSSREFLPRPEALTVISKPNSDHQTADEAVTRPGGRKDWEEFERRRRVTVRELGVESMAQKSRPEPAFLVGSPL